jgi:DNA repair photolyase
MAEQLFEVARRTFDTPEFRGIEFIEVEAKSIINRVPGNGVPFDWSINPYRGCTHACTYCLSGDTPVLMADGRTKPIAKLDAGDQVYGTARRGWYRRYVRTEVLAHWETAKRAYRITLEDGTEIIASGDHRFLTDRGWKHVTGVEQGGGRRPFLTESDSLVGIGAFVDAPIEGDAYRRGYLTGMIRGDGHVGSYTDSGRQGRRSETVHRFRLAPIDEEGLERTSAYLEVEGVVTTRFEFEHAKDGRAAMMAIRTSSRGGVDRIRDLIEWPRHPSESWHKGFLAGIFDAEGTSSLSVVRISNADAEILRRVARSLDVLGFSYVVEDQASPNGVQNIRLLGGSRERLAFIHTVDPAITRKRTINGLAIKGDAPLRVVAVEDLGLEMPMFDITTGTGDFIANGVVSHNCFARPTHTFLDMDAGRDFESRIVVKINAPDVLRRQLAAKRWKGEHIAMGTNTDPYQRAEGRYGLMPGIIRALMDYRNPFSILTKGTLILRDLDLLVEAARVAEVGTAFSIGTLDEDAWRRSEPGTPHPRARIDAVRALNEAGVPCGVLMAPILPGISDHPNQLREVAGAAIDAGATHVSPILLHLRPGVREEFMPWLAEQYPDLVPRYEAMYAKPYASAEERKALGRRVTAIVHALGGTRPPAERPDRWRPADAHAPPSEPRQLKLV